MNTLMISNTSAQAVFRVLSTVTQENLDKAQLDDNERGEFFAAYDSLMNLNLTIDVENVFKQVTGACSE